MSKKLELEIQQEIYNTPLIQTLQRPFQERYSNFKHLLEHFGKGNIPEHILESFREDYKKDYILENLQSHDYRQMEKTLKKFLGKSFVRVVAFDEGSSSAGKNFCWLYLKGTEELSLLNVIAFLKESSEFKHILDFYNYSVSKYYGSGEVALEPKYSDSANGFVYDRCHGIGYHITTQNKVEQILRTGLRCRTGDSEELRRRGLSKNYREFPKRIYFMSFLPEKEENIISRIKQEAEDLGKDENLAILKIKVVGNVYRDTGMPESLNAFFTYHNIPSNYIERTI